MALILFLLIKKTKVENFIHCILPSFETCSVQALCSSTQFACESAMCIDSSKVCDYHADCSDGSDERFCGTCDFDTVSG